MKFSKEAQRALLEPLELYHGWQFIATDACVERETAEHFMLYLCDGLSLIGSVVGGVREFRREDGLWQWQVFRGDSKEQIANIPEGFENFQTIKAMQVAYAENL